MFFTVSLMFIGKIILALFGEGFLATICLWPINDQPTSKGQLIVFIALSIAFLGWLFNWYHINISFS